MSRIPYQGTLIIGIFALSVSLSAVADTYGAIAYDAYSKVYGYSTQYDNRTDAEQAALAYCQEAQANENDNCDVELWFRNAYGALAVGSDGFGSGWAVNRNEAQYQAMQVCQQYSDECDIVLTISSED